MVGHLNGFFGPREGNLNKPIFKSSNAGGVARGGCPGGYSSFDLTGTLSGELVNMSTVPK